MRGATIALHRHYSLRRGLCTVIEGELPIGELASSDAVIITFKAYAGMEYRKFEETNLRDVPYEVYLKYRDKLPEKRRKRAEHWYTEYDRVQKHRGDIEEFGRLSFESGKSSIYNWETGSPELKKLYEIMTETDGIYGGRFSGAEFKGCCIALIDLAFEENIKETVTKEYPKAFPHLDGKYSVHICESADGVHLR